MPEDLLEDDDNEPKNINFAQVYPAGWDRLLNMPTSNPQATRLYALLANLPSRSPREREPIDPPRVPEIEHFALLGSVGVL